jgi:hypothetical protein
MISFFVSFHLSGQGCIVCSTSLNYSFPWLQYEGGHFWEMWAVSGQMFVVHVLEMCVTSNMLIMSHFYFLDNTSILFLGSHVGITHTDMCQKSWCHC